MKDMTFEELAAVYCETQECEPHELEEKLIVIAERDKPIGFMLLQCVMMDSSYFGSHTIMPFGPNNTHKELPDLPISPRGMASDMSIVVGVMPAAQLE
jgi:hypothetical protein